MRSRRWTLTRACRRPSRCARLPSSTDRDPNKFADAKKFETLKYIEILNKGLQVMDSTATSLCMDNKIPLVVFNIDDHTNIVRAALGENIGTTVDAGE